jgi:hypothetical protein
LNHGHYDALWADIALTSTVAVVSFAPRSVIFERVNNVDGNRYTYRGVISSPGDRIIDGVVVGHNNQQATRFSAFWGSALEDHPATPAAARAANGPKRANNQPAGTRATLAQPVPDSAPGLIGSWGGASGSALYFDGHQTVQVPDSPALDLPDGSPWTLEAWVFAIGGNLPQHIVGKRGECGKPGGMYQIAIDHNGKGKGMGVEPTDVPTNAWSQLAIAADGMTGWTVYVNGKAVKTVSDPGQKFQSAGRLIIGGSGTCARFIGLVDRVSLYSRALPANEVKSRYLAASERLKTPLAIVECENANCGAGKIGGNIATWSFNGPWGTAVWPAAGTISALIVEQFGSNGVTIVRTNTFGSKTEKGLTAVYRGRINGDQIDGNVEWTWTGFKTGSAQGTWHARIATDQIQIALAKAQREWLDSQPNPQQAPNILLSKGKGTLIEMMQMFGRNPHDCGTYVGACNRGDERACSDLNYYRNEMQIDFDAYRDQCRQGDKDACEARDKLKERLAYCTGQ